MRLSTNKPTLNPTWFHLRIHNYMWKDCFSKEGHLCRFWASLVAQLVKNLPAIWRPGFDPCVGKIPWRRERQSTPLFWPREIHGLYSPRGHKGSDTAEQLSLSLCRFWGLQLEHNFEGHYKTCCNLVRKEIIIPLFYRWENWGMEIY